jgi:hypothetical protein
MSYSPYRKPRLYGRVLSGSERVRCPVCYIKNRIGQSNCPDISREIPVDNKLQRHLGTGIAIEGLLVKAKALGFVEIGGCSRG